MDVSVGDNFESILELRYNLKKRCANEIKRDGNGDDNNGSMHNGEESKRYTRR